MGIFVAQSCELLSQRHRFFDLALELLLLFIVRLPCFLFGRPSRPGRPTGSGTVPCGRRRGISKQTLRTSAVLFKIFLVVTFLHPVDQYPGLVLQYVDHVVLFLDLPSCAMQGHNGGCSRHVR